MTNLEDQNTIKTFSKLLGGKEEDFQTGLRNPLNQDILSALDHNDMWGIESKIFGICFQEVRKAAGPFKIFGSQENSLVSSCVHAHADAWQKTLKALGKEQ